MTSHKLHKQFSPCYVLIKFLNCSKIKYCSSCSRCELQVSKTSNLSFLNRISSQLLYQFKQVFNVSWIYKNTVLKISIAKYLFSTNFHDNGFGRVIRLAPLIMLLSSKNLSWNEWNCLLKLSFLKNLIIYKCNIKHSVGILASCKVWLYVPGKRIKVYLNSN